MTVSGCVGCLGLESGRFSALREMDEVTVELPGEVEPLAGQVEVALVGPGGLLGGSQPAIQFRSSS